MREAMQPSGLFRPERLDVGDAKRALFDDLATSGESMNDQGLVISGNEQGLRSLAQHLLTVADARVAHGVHAHLEPGLELEDDSVAIVIEKAAEADVTIPPGS